MIQKTEKTIIIKNIFYTDIDHLKPQCEKCFGICCVALYFSKLDGFPTDKAAGTPCPYLTADFHCDIHDKLVPMGCKGCTVFECFGAGQQVSQVTFAGKDWRKESSTASKIFEAFLVMRQLHELFWYLNEALSFKSVLPIQDDLRRAISDTERITGYPPEKLLKFDVATHWTKTIELLTTASKLERHDISRENKIIAKEEHKSPADYFGKDLRKKDLRCADLRGACIIAANLEETDLLGTDFTGADLRDANLKGADLSHSLFLTQPQINGAKGDLNTKLPASLVRPRQWE